MAILRLIRRGSLHGPVLAEDGEEESKASCQGSFQARFAVNEKTVRISQDCVLAIFVSKMVTGGTNVITVIGFSPMRKNEREVVSLWALKTVILLVLKDEVAPLMATKDDEQNKRSWVVMHDKDTD